MLRQVLFGFGVALLTIVMVAPVFAQATEEPAQPQPVDVFQGAGILVLQTPDGAFKWWLDGRLMIDGATYSNSDNTLSNGVIIRRGRFAANLVLWRNWASQFDIDFSGNAVDIKDAWIGYTGLKNSMVKVGNFKEPFGLESLISSRYISFMERPLIDNFSPDRRLGMAFSHWQNRWQASAGVFGPALDDTIDTIGQDQTYSATGRFTALPLANASGTRLVHVGVAASMIQPKAATAADLSDANILRARARPETYVNQGRFIDSGKIKNVDHASLYGVEVAAVAGPVSVQGEYNREYFRRTQDTLVAPMFDGSYVFVSWFPTGEHRAYDRAAGEFDRLMPKSPRGALELLARYSMMDLNDPAAAIAGGREKITTAGVNYYFNANVRMMVNYAFVVNDGNAKGDRSYKTGDKFNTLQARLQINF
jgi:phosphate-selective porin OprO/OprP